jgi:anti-sigma factor ChrR (cupin superfamily)
MASHGRPSDLPALDDLQHGDCCFAANSMLLCISTFVGEFSMPSRGHTDIAASEIEWRDGQAPGIRYSRFCLDEANASAPSIILSKFEPGATVEAHTHDSNYFEYIIEGGQTVGKTHFGAGDVRIVKGGTGYGPITVGPDGCTVLIVFEDGSRSNTEFLPRQKKATEPA